MAAARLYQQDHKKWPLSARNLDSYFQGKTPTDPVSNGGDFIFHLTEEKWQAESAAIKSYEPASVFIPIITTASQGQ